MTNTIDRCTVCGSSMLLEICECVMCGFQGTHHEMMNEHGHTQSTEKYPNGKFFFTITTQKKCVECGTKGEY